MMSRYTYLLLKAVPNDIDDAHELLDRIGCRLQCPQRVVSRLTSRMSLAWSERLLAQELYLKEIALVGPAARLGAHRHLSASASKLMSYHYMKITILCELFLYANRQPSTGTRVCTGDSPIRNSC
jgi:hypothetical protein